MAAPDFPASPTVGQTYTAPSGLIYTWDGKVWTTTAGAPATFVTGRVIRSTAQSAAHATATDIIFSAAEGAIAVGMWSAGNPTRLVAPVDGYYIFGGSMEFAPNTTGVRVLYLRFGAGLIEKGKTVVPVTTAAGGPCAMTAVAGSNMVAGDYVVLSVYHDSGAPLNINASPFPPNFWMAKVG